MGKKILIAAVILAVVLGGLFAVERFTRQSGDQSAEDIVMKGGFQGKVLPDLKIKNIATGQTVGLHSFKGKVVLINFWASWCEACIEEMPSIVKLYETLKDDGFDVLAINVDEEPEKVVPNIVKKFNMTFPIYVDSEEKLAESFNVVAIPYSIVVGKDMKVAWSESGERNWASKEVIQQMKELLKQ